MWLAADYWALQEAAKCVNCTPHNKKMILCGENTLQDHSNQLATNLQIAVDTVWQFVAS